MYILLVYERELSKNDYLKTLLITIIKSIKKLIKKIVIVIIISRETFSWIIFQEILRLYDLFFFSFFFFLSEALYIGLIYEY